MYWRLLIGVIVGSGFGALLGYFGQCSSGTCPLTATWWRGAIFGALIGATLVASMVTRTP
jgi:hypothetical protein